MTPYDGQMCFKPESCDRVKNSHCQGQAFAFEHEFCEGTAYLEMVHTLFERHMDQSPSP